MLKIAPNGLMFTRTLLASRARNGALAIDEARLRAQLAAAYGRPVTQRALRHIRRAGELMAGVKSGDWDARVPHRMNDVPVLARAGTMLALAGLHTPHPEAPERLAKMQEALNRGTAEKLLKQWGIPLAKDDDDDSDDEDDDSGADDAGSQDGGSETDSGSDDFDAEHPRWPAGSPGGIGGEFAPKDADASAPLDPDHAWTALTSAIDKPSKLPEGIQVAADDSTQSDGSMDTIRMIPALRIFCWFRRFRKH